MAAENSDRTSEHLHQTQNKMNGGASNLPRKDQKCRENWKPFSHIVCASQIHSVRTFLCRREQQKSIEFQQIIKSE